MTRQAIPIPMSTGLMIVALMVVSAASAYPWQEPPEAKKDKAGKENGTEADKEYRRAAEQVVAAIELEVLVEDKWSKVTDRNAASLVRRCYPR